jgi:hypothetical protein
VKTLQGSSGALSLTAGTGIGISGLTISNTGIVNLSAGSGISVSGNEITNTGVLGVGGGTTAYLSGDIKLVAGNSISISQGTDTITIDNTYSPPTNILTSSSTYVKTLDGSSGALTLGSGTGISISGLTITNTGIISASAGNGISVSGSDPLTITNTGVLGVGGGTTSYLTGDIKFIAGSDISITQSGQDITIANTYAYTLPSTVLTSSSTYVKTLQGSSGELSLSAGGGISISGLTISNSGVTALTAGSGISLSGSTGDVTVTNAGVISLQGDTGSLSLASGSGISISGLTITNVGVLGVGGGTTSYLTGDIKLVAGSDINISQSGQDITIANTYSYTLPSSVLTNSSTYVKTLQGNSGTVSFTAGSGISISDLTFSNTGVLGLGGGTTAYLTGNIELKAGNSISISQSADTITITNTYTPPANILTNSSTYVKTLDGSSGALSLGSGSGISISGLTITNTGVLGVGGGTTSYLTGDVKFVAGSNIDITQSGQDITISNTYSLPSTVLTSSSTYVKTLQGSSGALSLSSGTGISISGLTISNSGVTSLTAGTGISLSGSTGDVTITSSGASYTAGNGISISSGTIAMSGTMGIGVNGMIFEGDASNPTIEVYDTASTTYRIQIGQVSSAAEYFNNAVVGDSIIRGNYQRLLLGAGHNNSALVLTSDYAVETENNTLDDGSGDMTIAGSLSASGTLLTTGSLGLDLGDSVGVRALIYDANGTAGYQTGYGVNVVGVNSLDFFIGYGNGSNTSFNIGSGGNSTYPYTSYKRLFTVANTGEITTVKNTLDDGSGNMTVAGTLEGTFAGVLSAGTVGISDGGDSVVDSPYGMGILGYNQFFSNNTGYTIYLFLYGSSAVGSSGASGVTEIGSIDNGAVYSIPYSSNNTGVLTANNGGSCIAIWFAV